MTAEPRSCPYCGRKFSPSVFHPDQQICSRPECRRRQRKDYHSRKYHTDAEYRLVCQDSNRKWRVQNSSYQRRYRQDHPAYVEKNRSDQKRRDRKRRVQDLVKNNLAISELMIFQSVAVPTESRA